MAERARAALGELRNNPQLVIGGGILVTLVGVAIFAPLLAPRDPVEQDLLSQLLPPFWGDRAEPAFALGTDNLGRDILSRLIYGTRPALIVMTLGATLSALIGSLLGLFAGYYGGWVDNVISRLVEILMSFPPMLLAIILVAVIGSGLNAVVIAIIVIGWTRFCRVVRGEVMVLREQDFVTSAITIGMSRRAIMFRELLPNVAPILLVLLTLEMGRAIMVEAILAFIGFSASGMATWGGMIADGRSYIYQAWTVMALPVLCLLVSVLGLNMLGDGLRKATDPVLRR
jgi:dipeptide transport system permease protein